jgi:hypothetical protein
MEQTNAGGNRAEAIMPRHWGGAASVLRSLLNLSQ